MLPGAYAGTATGAAAVVCRFARRSRTATRAVQAPGIRWKSCWKRTLSSARRVSWNAATRTASSRATTIGVAPSRSKATSTR